MVEKEERVRVRGLGEPVAEEGVGVEGGHRRAEGGAWSERKRRRKERRNCLVLNAGDGGSGG